MLKRIDDLPEGVYGLRAAGMVSKQDYDDVVEPMLGEARGSGRRIRLLYHFAPEFEGFTPGAAWEDAQVGLRFLRLFERCAIVSDKGWIRAFTRGFAPLMPCPVRVFDDAQLDEAISWLARPVASAHVAHRLVPEHQVLLVEPKAALTAEDFDAIALTVDPWLESGHALNGIVVHMHDFPGWENVGSFVRHIRFIRDHHRKIRRVALCADGTLAKLAPAFAEVFVGAEVQQFGDEELDRAIEWAGRQPAGARTSPAG